MATITEVPGTDTVNQMRVTHNANDVALDVEVEAATAAIAAHKASGNTDHDGRYSKITDLDTHKTSTDHDGRYYTETEIDALAVKLTGDQDVDGVKSFLDPLVIKNGAAGVELKTAAGAPVAKFIGVVAGADTMVALYAYSAEQAQYVQMMRAYPDDESADFPFVDLYCRGKRLATIDEVQERVRTGYFSLNMSHSVATSANAETRFPQVMTIPAGARLVSADFVRHLDDHSGASSNRSAASVVFTSTGYRYLSVILMHGAAFTGTVFPYVKIQAGSIVAGQLTWTDVLTVDAVQEEAITIGDTVYMNLQLGFTY